MSYRDEIEKILPLISTNVINFDEERTRSSAPTQVSSEFLTNKEQGDWAEKTLLDGINNNSSKYIAVKYGRDDDIIAGEPGFKEFYENYQDELDTVGKRPDILIFTKEDFPYDERNISHWDLEKLDEIVPKAKCGIEVRSSAFLIEKYEDSMNRQEGIYASNVLNLRDMILREYGELLKEKDSALFNVIYTINSDNLHAISFRAKSWSSTEELARMSAAIKELKDNLQKITKRTFLSITPKVEDLKVVRTWIKRYNVPHYYVQVFFDRAYGISFKKILENISTPEKENVDYFIESDVKNQNKTTIKIRANSESEILSKINLPEHYSEMRELGRGRLLFYVKFKNSISVINKKGFEDLFGFELV